MDRNGTPYKHESSKRLSRQRANDQNGTEVVARKQLRDFLAVIDEAMGRWPIGVASSAEMGGKPSPVANDRPLVVERLNFQFSAQHNCTSEN